jgi:hypothetical protein
MSEKTGSAHSKYAGLLPIEPSDDFFRPIDLKPEPIAERIDLKPEDVPFPNWQPSARKRTRSLARFLIAFCTGVAATLLWQSYGDAAGEMIANLYPPQLGWLAPRPALSGENRDTPDAIAPAGPSAEQLNAMSIDLDVVGQNVEKIATTIAAGREPTPDSVDQIATGQEQMIRSTDQTTTSVDEAPTKTASNVTVESQGDAASLKPASRLTDARPPQTLAGKGKPLSAMSGHDGSCFASASDVMKHHPGAWATWTLRAPGREGTICWYAAARHRVSDHRSRVSDYRREMLPEEIETLGTAESGLYAPFVPYGRGGSWEGGLP